MASLLDLPDFMFQNNNKRYGKFSKILITLFGLFIGFLHKNLHGKLFCFAINLFFKNDGKIYFRENLYNKKLSNNQEFSYPTKRIDRVIVDHESHFEKLFNSYCLNNIQFNPGDTVIDCGANVGELFISFVLNNVDINYIGFEPDPKVFSVLKKNLKDYDVLIYDVALSDSNNYMPLYLNTEGADSSLIYFGKNEKVSVDCKTIDSFNFKNIKLLKIEAEGGEIEVLKGSKKSLKNIEYISVDYGPERGENRESTSVEIINFLYKNQFKLVNVSKYREIGLFKNLNI